MRKVSKKNYVIAIALILFAIAVIIALPKVNSIITQSKLDIENQMAKKYGELEDEDYQTQSPNVEFSVFFTRDYDGDGYAERIRGTARDIQSTDEILWAEIKVSNGGHLDNGQITLNAQNFTWSTSIVEDSVVSGNYIGNNTQNIRLQEKVYAGSQRLLEGKISSKIGNNINDYSKVNTMTLKGTYVDDEGNSTPIAVTREVTVDWYGSISTSISYQNTSILVSDNGVRVGGTISTRVLGGLLVKENEVTASAPKLSGYYPVSVAVSGVNSKDYSYDEETGKLTILKSSNLNAETGAIGNLINSINNYSVSFEYPKEAIPYNTWDDPERTFSVEIPVTSKYTVYNNQTSDFDNILQSQSERMMVCTEGKLGNGTIINEASVRIGEKVSDRYIIPKEKAVQAYNNQETKDDCYETVWYAYTQYYTNSVTFKENGPDKFVSTKNGNFNADEYISYDGIYFSGNADSAKVYNEENGEVIKEFSRDDIRTYQKNNYFKYDNNIKKVKVEVYGINNYQSFSVHNVKEIDDKLLVEQMPEEDFNSIEGIYSYLSVNQNLNEVNAKTSTFTHYAEYRRPESVLSLKINPNISEIQNSNIKQTISIKTTSDQSYQMGWKNGIFLVEFPEDIVFAENLNVDSSNVDIVLSNLYKENNKYYAEIVTENEERMDYDINLSVDITLNPIAPSSSEAYILYGYNEDCNTYLTKSKDIYDINNNDNYEEEIGKISTNLGITAPSTLITTQTVSNYNKDGTVTIAPNIAEVTKEDRTADINVNVFNNYDKTISEVKILGVIPFEGNTYIDSETGLGSEFTSEMTSNGIKVPSNLEGKVTVYYSENPKATKELGGDGNNWTTTPEDFSRVRSYLIDFNTTKLSSGTRFVFTYTVEIPTTAKYNEFAFSHHKIYYAIETKDVDTGRPSKITTEVQPNKVGIRKVRTYELDIAKLNIETRKPVGKGAKYKLIEYDEEDNEFFTQIITSNAEGKLIAKNLYVNRKYSLEEVSSPNNYMLDNKKFEFKVTENDSEELQIEVLSDDNFETSPEIEGDVVKATILEKPRFELIITKKDNKTEELLKGIQFEILDEEKVRASGTTNEEGKVTLAPLDQEVDYTLKETYAHGYYLLDDIDFRLVKEETGFKIESDKTELSEAQITVSEEQDLIKVETTLQDDRQPSIEITKVDESTQDPIPGVMFMLDGRDDSYTTNEEGKITIDALVEDQEYTLKEIRANGYYLEDVTFTITRDEEGNLKIVSENENFADAKVIDENKKILGLTFENEKIPTYDLKIKKIEEENEGKTLQGAKFQLYSEDTTVTTEHTTNAEGIIEIPNLCGFVEGREGVTGRYVLREIEAPEGYGNNAEEIKFRVVKNGEDLQVEILNSGEVETVSSSEISEGVLNLVIEDKPLFTLIKKDKETGEPIKNASFIIKEVNIPYDYAKDINGEYIGTLNEEGQRIVTTDENGKITLSLRDGKYVLIEVGYPEGYEKEEVIQFFEVTTGVKEVEDSVEPIEEPKEIEYIENIETIDDLVKLSEQVNSGIDYTGHTVTLTKTLDFENASTFTPIGNSSNTSFSGIFDGNGYEIKNTNLDYPYDSGVGLFGYTENAKIMNLGISGNITGRDYVGVIVGYATNSSIYNCYNKANITGRDRVGGIVGQAANSSIYNCYNTVNITGNDYVGGIVGISGIIYNCYNIGNITGKEKVGRIIGDATNISTYNCYYKEGITIEGTTKNEIGISKPETEMKLDSFIEDLGKNNFEKDKESINDGYPILLKYTIPDRITSINNIEDLVELSNQVRDRDSYENVIINLEKTLDFDQETSYENADDRSYGDLNGDNKVTGIKEELTSELGFTPIGSNFNAPFSGIFNGNGYEIKNIHINSSNDDVGLFGYVSRGKIINLGVSGNITGKKDVGGIAGYINGSRIYNCYNKANISGTNTNGNVIIGGIAGSGDQYNVNNIIRNCYNIGNISGSTMATTINNSAWLYLGGILGQGENVYNCYNVGDISGEIRASAYKNKVTDSIGPIIGKANNEKAITNCYYREETTINGNTKNEIGTSKPETEMRADTFIEELGSDDFAKDSEEQNDGYPILLKYNLPERITKIENIEDLVELSNQVQDGDTYAGIEITLEKTLDFNEAESYNDPEDERFGDLNGDGDNTGIKDELTSIPGKGFTPIGCIEAFPFSGIFDGKNNEIKNINFNTENKNGYLGLFGYAKNVTIKNLGIYENLSGRLSYFGSIVGELIGSGNLENCYFNGKIENTGGYVGGLIGYTNSDNTSTVSLSKCYNLGEIISANDNAGGLIANTYGYQGKSNIVFNDCYNEGNLTGRSVGALIGYNYVNCTITNCNNTGDLIGKTTSGSLGGLIGFSGYNLNIINSYNTGNISGDADKVGGLVGSLSDNNRGSGIIKNCYNEGDILTSAYNLGGLVGYSYTKCDFIDSYNTGNVSTTYNGNSYIYIGGICGTTYDGIIIKNCYNTGIIEGTSYMGGILGYGSSAKSITNCYNTGEIRDVGLKSNSYSIIGGILGFGYCEINECYNTGDIVTNNNKENPFYIGGITGWHGTVYNSYNTGNIVGYRKASSLSVVGGIVGYDDNAINCYNAGNITCVSTNGAIAIGGIAGYASSNTTTNCYNIGDITGKSENAVYIGGIKGQGRANNSYNTGTISGTSNYSLAIGGICGWSYTLSNNAYNTGDIIANYNGNSSNCYVGGINASGSGTSNNIYNIGNITVKSNSGCYVGGLINSGSIINGYNAGNISVESSNGKIYVGGLLGNGYDVENSTNTGNIEIKSLENNSSNDIFVGGIKADSGSVKNSNNKGNITANLDNINLLHLGGIVGNNSNDIISSNNIGNIQVDVGKNSGLYIGGIVGNTGPAKQCINKGNIDVYYSGNQSGNTNDYIAGIVGSGSAEGCYNIGNLNISLVNVQRSGNAYAYIGSISGSGRVINSCNLGNLEGKISNFSTAYVGRICGLHSSPSGNSYLNSMKYNVNTMSTSYSNSNGGETGIETIEVPEITIKDIIDIKSMEFFIQLNQDGVWTHIDGYLPKLLIKDAKTVDSTQIEIENKVEILKLTTDIDESDGVRGGFISGEDKDPYEKIKYNESNKNEIEIIPDDGYEIESIKVNEENIPYDVDENGAYTIQPDYFTHVKEDKKVIVKFALKEKILTINKVDADDEELKVKGAKFDIESIDGSNEIFGKITKYDEDDQFYFEEHDGTLIGNSSDYRDIAYSYMKIDLSKLDGEYYVVLNAQAYGNMYANISKDNPEKITSTSTYTKDNFMYCCGYYNYATDFASPVLEGGNVYYLNLYAEGTTNPIGNKINSIRLFKKTLDNSSCLGKLTPNDTTRWFEKDAETGVIKLSSGTSGTEGAYSYMQIDLTGKVGTYNVILNMDSTATSPVTVSITSDISPVKDTSPYNHMIYSISQIPNTTFASVPLAGGKIYYLHLSYYGGAPATEININSVELVKGELTEIYDNSFGDENLLIDENELFGKLLHDDTQTSEYPFSYYDGKYLNTVTNPTSGYVEVDLTDKEGDYNILVDTNITSSSGTVMMTVSEKEKNITDISPYSKFVYITNPTERKVYSSTTLKGGKKYNLLLKQSGGNYQSVNIYDIKLVENKNIATFDNTENDVFGQVTKNGDYGFEYSDGKLLPSTEGLATSYIPINLSDKDGKYAIAIKLSTKSSAITATINDNTEQFAETGYYSDKVFVWANSGGPSYGVDSDYVYVSNVLEGGNTYYLHLVATLSGGESYPASIDSIELIEYTDVEQFKNNKGDKFKVEGVTTDENGQLKVSVPHIGKYLITETEAPEGYTLDSTPRIVKITEKEDNNITIENKKKQPLVVHHYLKDAEGNETTTKVADDETAMYDLGAKYTTSPKTDLPNLELEREETDGDEVKYKLPPNASGEIVDGGVEVKYYYKVIPVELNIHHYLEGTGEKLAKDENIEYETKVDIENDKVTNISTEQTYEVEENSNYKTLSEKYEPTIITQDDNIVSEEEIEFSKDSELVYYYALSDSDIKIRYVDKQTDREIQDTETKPGKIGEEYNVEIKEIEDYTYVERDGELTGKYEAESKTITLYYSKKAKVTVKHIDRETEAVIETVNAEGLVGDQYTSTVKEFPHYRNVSKPDDETVTMKEEEITLEYYYEKIKTNVVEKHIDDITKDVIEEETHVGNEGDEYEILPKEIPGYDLVDDEDKMPKNAKGTRDQASIEVVYYYVKKAEVIVQYIDSATNEPIETETKTGHENDPYETEGKEIEGYDLDTTRLPDNATGTMKVTVRTGESDEKIFENQTIVKYYYNRKTRVIERHYDNRTETLIEEKVHYGHEGDSYSIPSKTFDRYVLNEDRLPEKPSGEMTKEDIIVSYYYKYESTITTKYQDKETGKDIIPPKTEEIFDGEEYTTEPEIIEGYDLDEEDLPEDPEGTIGKEDKIVIYYYHVHREDTMVTVNHIDVMNDEILATRKIAGKVGDKYKAESETFAKYDLMEDRLPDNAEGEMTEEEIIVNYYYKYRATITTRYVDEETNEDIVDPDEQDVPEGDDYTTIPKEIDDYELDEEKIPENNEGETPKSDVEVVYYYKKKNIDARVIAKYVDVITNEEIDSKTYTGKVGDTYKTEAKEIEKYDLVGIPENAEGTMTKEDIIVIYYYKHKSRRIVRYVDIETDKDIYDPEITEVHEGDEYTSKEKEIEGYELIKKPNNASGKMTKEDEEIIYYYKKKSEPVIVEKPIEKIIIKTVKTGDIIIRFIIITITSIIFAIVTIFKKDNK